MTDRDRHALFVLNAHLAAARARARERNGVRLFRPCTCDLCRAARRWNEARKRAAR